MLLYISVSPHSVKMTSAYNHSMAVQCEVLQNHVFLILKFDGLERS